MMVMSITTTCQPTPALWLCFLHLVGFKYEVVNLKPPKSRKRSHNAGVELAGCRDAHHHRRHTGSANSVPIILKFQDGFCCIQKLLL